MPSKPSFDVFTPRRKAMGERMAFGKYIRREREGRDMTLTELDARIVELTAIVKMLERTLYGTRSERLRSDKPSDEQAAAIVAALFDLWEKELPRLSGKSKLAEARGSRKLR